MVTFETVIFVATDRNTIVTLVAVDIFTTNSNIVTAPSTGRGVRGEKGVRDGLTCSPLDPSLPAP